MYAPFLKENSHFCCIGIEEKIFDDKADDNPFIFFCNLCMGFRFEVCLFVCLRAIVPCIGIVLY